MPVTFAIASLCEAANASSVPVTACHQSAGSCSDQPGCGRDTATGALAVPMSA